jgi:hypothetical protein
MYFALRASLKLFKSAPADLVPTKPLGNDGFFLSLCVYLKSTSNTMLTRISHHAAALPE